MGDNCATVGGFYNLVQGQAGVTAAILHISPNSIKIFGANTEKQVLQLLS